MPFSTNCSKRGTHATTPKGKNFHVDLKCAQKWDGLELFTPIASNKNNSESNKNMEAMTHTTKAQLLR